MCDGEGRGRSSLPKERWTEEQAFPFLFQKMSAKATWGFSRQRKYWAAQHSAQSRRQTPWAQRCLFNVECVNAFVELCAFPLLCTLGLQSISTHAFSFKSVTNMLKRFLGFFPPNIMFAYNVFSTD